MVSRYSVLQTGKCNCLFSISSHFLSRFNPFFRLYSYFLALCPLHALIVPRERCGWWCRGWQSASIVIFIGILQHCSCWPVISVILDGISNSIRLVAAEKYLVEIVWRYCGAKKISWYFPSIYLSHIYQDHCNPLDTLSSDVQPPQAHLSHSKVASVHMVQDSTSQTSSFLVLI